jgi:hypothetical protein
MGYQELGMILFCQSDRFIQRSSRCLGKIGCVQDTSNLPRHFPPAK